MKTILTLVSILLIFLSACSNPQHSESQQKEQEAVQQSFKNYKASILEDNGSQAIKFVDSKTITYYSELLDLILEADSAKVNALNIMDKFQVLTVRARIETEKLRSFDGKQLLEHTIDQGMTSKSVAGIAIENIIVDGNFAKGQLLTNGKSAPFYFHFYKEEGNWKIDLTSIFKISMTAFNQMIKESGQEENEFIFTLLESVSGRRPDNAIWQPIR